MLSSPFERMIQVLPCLNVQQRLESAWKSVAMLKKKPHTHLEFEVVEVAQCSIVVDHTPDVIVDVSVGHRMSFSTVAEGKVLFIDSVGEQAQLVG